MNKIVRILPGIFLSLLSLSSCDGLFTEDCIYKGYLQMCIRDSLKMMKRCKKPFLIFIRTEIAGYDYKQSKKEVLLNN